MQRPDKKPSQSPFKKDVRYKKTAIKGEKDQNLINGKKTVPITKKRQDKMKVKKSGVFFKYAIKEPFLKWFLFWSVLESNAAAFLQG